MHSYAIAVLMLFAVPQISSQSTQSAVVRDPKAIVLLQQSIAAMAAIAPSDSVEGGSVQITAGGSTSQGTIQILTRGTAQSSMQVQTSDANWTIIYSQGQSSRTDNATSTAMSLEASATSQCTFFPLAFLSGMLQNPDISLQFIVAETLNGSSVWHLRTWNTFQSNPLFQFLSAYTVTDIWLDAASGLPRRISFVKRDGGGAMPKIPITIDYLSFQNVNGISYPTEIQESVEGTPWMTISIQSASFNSGLTDANFPIVQEGN